jgi:DNA polymerase delta subunit 2
MLEDASGRIRLVGDPLKVARLVTGVIIGALGMENPNGDFEIVDICDAGLAPQSSFVDQPSNEDEMDVDGMFNPYLDHPLMLTDGTKLIRQSRIHQMNG